MAAEKSSLYASGNDPSKLRASREPTSSPNSAMVAAVKSSRHERDASVSRRSRSETSTSGIFSPRAGWTTKCTRAVVDSLILTVNSIDSPAKLSLRISENRSRTLVL